VEGWKRRAEESGVARFFGEFTEEVLNRAKNAGKETKAGQATSKTAQVVETSAMPSATGAKAASAKTAAPALASNRGKLSALAKSVALAAAPAPPKEPPSSSYRETWSREELGKALQIPKRRSTARRESLT
jgi:hypothetical protein